MTPFPAAAAVLIDAIERRAFPGASVEVGRHDGPLWQEGFGAVTYDAGAAPVATGTIFDLASLTKVLCTTTLAMRLIDDGRLRLDDAVADWLPEWRGADRADVTVRDLLAHASGLPAYLPFYRDLTGRAEFQAEVSRVALEYRPRTQAIYSDLGFILLGFIIEDARRGPLTGPTPPEVALAAQFHRLASFITPQPMAFRPPRVWRPRIAPTELDPWRGRLLVGEVHDENAWALGGAAGHAGLFGTAAAVGAFARASLHTLRGASILAAPSTMRAFATKTDVPGSSRALGWDTMLPSSSCGTRLSPTAIGHTGFTGTSLWIDADQDLYVVLLTNRVHPTRENDLIREIRPRFHDAAAADALLL